MVSDDLLNTICLGITRRLISSNPHCIEVLIALLPVAIMKIFAFIIYTLSDLGVLSNLIGSLSLANEHYSPPTE